MTSRQDRLRAAVAAALHEIAVECIENCYGCWRVRLGGDFELNAALDNEWLQLCAPFARGRIHGGAIPRCAWEVLLRNSQLPGAAKLVTAPDCEVVHAALEIFLDIEAMPTPPTNDASVNPLKSQLAISIDHLKEATRRHPNRDQLADCRGTISRAADLPALCIDAGWTSTSRDGGRVVVQLETAHGFAQATLTWNDDLKVVVKLHRGERSLPALSRQAIAVMLLRLGGSVRVIRPAVFTESDHHSFMLQANMGPNPTARALDHVLAALSVAAGMCQSELALLSDEQISSLYLSARGWSASSQVPV